MEQIQRLVVHFDGINYAQWSHLMQNHLKGLKLRKCISGKVEIPDETDRNLIYMSQALEKYIHG